MVDKIGNFIGDKYRSIASNFMNTLKDSKFYEEGILTPEEFLQAGEFLTLKCPTWKWSSNKSNLVDYLPNNKQFITTSVPCIKRVSSYYKQNSNYLENNLKDDWTEPIFDQNNEKKLVKEISLNKEENCNNKVVINEIDDYCNFDIEPVKNEEEIKNDQIENDCFIVEVEDNIVKSRTYELSITYDYYYRVPRLWLIGYSESGNPLSIDEIKEDIVLDYYDKTVTIEKHPFLNQICVSIHPCKHSVLIKAMIKNFENNGKKLEVEKAILLLLKFFSSVIPTIKYDYTLDIDF
jgi:ubiquitin-like-conjugating enzyme ATG3